MVSNTLAPGWCFSKEAWLELRHLDGSLAQAVLSVCALTMPVRWPEAQKAKKGRG